MAGRLWASLRFLYDQVDRFRRGLRRVQPAAKDHTLLRKTRERVRIYRPILRTVFIRKREPGSRLLLNLPLQRTEAQFDLKPERDTQLELGGHIPVGSGDLGFRVWQKNANDLIDDTQVGVTLLHQDINYVLGRLSQEALNYVQPLSLNSRAYFTLLTSSRSTPAAKRSCSRHASDSPRALRPPTTSSATPSPAASCSTTGAAAGSQPTPITAAAFRRLSVRSIRRDTAKRRHTRFSTWKTESRYRRKPR